MRLCVIFQIRNVSFGLGMGECRLFVNLLIGQNFLFLLILNCFDLSQKTYEEGDGNYADLLIAISAAARVTGVRWPAGDTKL